MRKKASRLQTLASSLLVTASVLQRPATGAASRHTALNSQNEVISELCHVTPPLCGACRERQEKIRQLEEKLQDETDLLETRQAELQQLEVRTEGTGFSNTMFCSQLGLLAMRRAELRRVSAGCRAHVVC